MSPEAAPAVPEAASLRFRKPRPQDGAAMWRLVKALDGLELNSAYFYVLFAIDFADTGVVAETKDGELAGFIVGHRPPTRPESVFVWQIAVAPWMRRQGLGRRLLDELLARQAGDCSCLEATVSPDNTASLKLFRALARDRGLDCREQEFMGAALFPNAHAAEHLLRIGPLKPESIQSQGNT